MIIGSVVFILGVEQAFSLKEKRRIVNGLKRRLVNKFNVSVAEVGLQDTWNRCELAVVTVTGDKTRAEKLLSNVMNFVESFHDVEVMGISEEFI